MALIQGVKKVIEDFQAEKGQSLSYKLLKKKDLEIVLSQSITKNGYEGPVLLMSNKKKLRIMTLQPQEKDGFSIVPWLLLAVTRGVFSAWLFITGIVEYPPIKIE